MLNGHHTMASRDPQSAYHEGLTVRRQGRFIRRGLLPDAADAWVDQESQHRNRPLNQLHAIRLQAAAAAWAGSDPGHELALYKATKG